MHQLKNRHIPKAQHLCNLVHDCQLSQNIYLKWGPMLWPLSVTFVTSALVFPFKGQTIKIEYYNNIME
jgi:hypothetical protein